MNVIKINPSDNVVVAIEAVKQGETFEVDGVKVTAKADVMAGHKIAIADIPLGGEAIKYGYAIGKAKTQIAAGEVVHSNNLKTSLEGELEYTYQPNLTPLAPKNPHTFMGYRRENGKVGIRNEIWIIVTVGCVNSIGEIIAQRAHKFIDGSIGGIYCFPHPYGCSQLGDDHENTKKALCGLVNHPNAGGVLVLGLGCENNTIDGMKTMLGHSDTDHVKFLACQDVEDEVEAALTLIEELVFNAKGIRREEIPASELVVGLKCGGSDGLSGITANPLVGEFSDLLISEGGSTILTEVPEMFGAETILMNRCKDKEVFAKTVKLINDFKAYFTSYGQPVYENPSPGNKAGGITTLEDKSLGCTQKSGNATVVDVLSYGEPVFVKGLNLLNAPGNDLVASTALAVSGAHIILFTTGRGTPFGSPVPTVKISSNSALANKKKSWIDFDAGVLVSSEAKKAELAESLYELVLQFASGEKHTKTEIENIRDLAIFKSGVTL